MRRRPSFRVDRSEAWAARPFVEIEGAGYASGYTLRTPFGRCSSGGRSSAADYRRPQGSCERAEI
jgi:hypothetical protein